jgi:hypothetical protein
MTKSDARECYSFTVFSKFIAVLVFFWLGYLLIKSTSQMASVAWQEISLLALLFACLSWGLAYMLIAKTRVDDQYISESGLASKQVKISEIGKCKVIDIPGLRWLIIPRVVVQVSGFGSYTFRASDHEVLTHFNRMLTQASACAASSKPLEH